MKIREAAEFLGRSLNTISRQLGRNIVKDEYNTEKTHAKVKARRWRAKRQCLKVAMDSTLVRFVEEKLELK